MGGIFIPDRSRPHLRYPWDFQREAADRDPATADHRDLTRSAITKVELEPMDAKTKTSIEAQTVKLVAKAAEASDAAQAVNFAQAACNAANALKALGDARPPTPCPNCGRGNGD